MKCKHIPNVITLIRLMLVSPFLAFMVGGHYKISFFIFGIAGLSDGLDGFLARRYHWTSKFGSMMDPLADKILMLSAYVLLSAFNVLPVWLMLLVVTRDLVILAGVAGWFHVFGFANLNFNPTLISKLNTGLQVLLVIVALFQLAYQSVPANALTALIYVVGLTTAWSFINYVWVFGRKAYQHAHPTNPGESS